MPRPASSPPATASSSSTSSSTPRLRQPRAVATVPETEGVYELLGEDRVALKIAGTPNLAEALREELDDDSPALYFMFHPDPMYTQRESELIQQFLAQHGRMPGGDDLDDLF